MRDDTVARARRRYGGLIDPTLTTYDASLDLAADDRAEDVAERLAEHFRRHPRERVVLRLDGADVGISDAARLRRAQGVAGGADADVGAADRAGLLGRSTRFRAVGFVCGGCGRTAVLSYYDDRFLPTCADTADCPGPMELVR
ncbi:MULTISPECIES: hypothetical protein [Streptomyces]|uniref:Recombinase zinc beta ribbon domain-containing protein n=1 Tax=Streptomyces dengpaensis TaxID=2049881 RepID=A0ABN5HXK0_9ACTN|nr:MULTISPECIES: hypothetical protein [Streptomyces]AVH55325.1 hypothetical protein C4B68_05450 [Streptomyces dengpaensis]PIB06969.1 hypothetical protein B1C81_21600 [Streptomyces sp. HG99]